MGKITVITPTIDNYPKVMKRNSKGQFIKIKPEKRFWDKVKKTKDCWVWTGATNSYGYGKIHINGNTSKKAHRFVMEMKLGKTLSPEEKVCHKCDNPKCVNPSHLFVGTQVDNIRDMLDKKRNPYFGSKGHRNPRSKLSKGQVEEIREKYVPYKYSTFKLAEEYGVAQQTVSKIINYKRYVY